MLNGSQPPSDGWMDGCCLQLWVSAFFLNSGNPKQLRHATYIPTMCGTPPPLRGWQLPSGITPSTSYSPIVWPDSRFLSAPGNPPGFEKSPGCYSATHRKHGRGSGFDVVCMVSGGPLYLPTHTSPLVNRPPMLFWGGEVPCL